MLEGFVTSFASIVAILAPIDIGWIFGLKAYHFIVDTLTGRNAHL